METAIEPCGTLDKFIEDAMIGIWGMPVVDGSHADHLLSCVLGMFGALVRFNRPFTATRRTLDGAFVDHPDPDPAALPQCAT